MVRVLIVEDDPMARTLFELYLKHSGRYELAAAIESASMAAVLPEKSGQSDYYGCMYRVKGKWAYGSGKDQKEQPGDTDRACDLSAGM